jgi:hypothetical protein
MKNDGPEVSGKDAYVEFSESIGSMQRVDHQPRNRYG